MRTCLHGFLLTFAACGMTPEPTQTPAPAPIALARMEDGLVALCDPTTLAVQHRWPGRPAPAPMLIARDDARRCFYVGNFRGGLGRVPWSGGEPDVLELGGAMIGLALDPRGALLAVNGAFDLRLRLVDLEHWSLLVTVPLGDATDPPRHSHLTHGLMSTHPAWEPDGSRVLTQDNVHEAVLRITRDGHVCDRTAMPAAVHALLPRQGGGWLAVGEGAVDGTVPPFVAWLAAADLANQHLTTLPLQADEKAKLHHADLAGDDLLVAANMGPMHGDGAGRSVHAIDLHSRALRWSASGPLNAGHVRWLGDGRVAVLGHRDPDIAVLDLRDGSRSATWTVPGATALGHAIEREPDGALLIVDNGAGRVVRLRDGALATASPSLGPGTWEASLRE